MRENNELGATNVIPISQAKRWTSTSKIVNRANEIDDDNSIINFVFEDWATLFNRCPDKFESHRSLVIEQQLSTFDEED